MKNLVLCFDGTWNGLPRGRTTNIGRLAHCLAKGDACARPQIVFYLPGVGTNYRADRYLGGAFGLGLTQAMMTGYRFLASNYDEGDKIFIFGFSRGAYAARSLTGMLEFPGLLREGVTSMYTDYASYLYQIHSQAVARGRNPMQEGCKEFGPRGRTRRLEENFQSFQLFVRREAVAVSFLGVFDTVGALGPNGLRPGANAHNVQLSSAVSTARHALAIDEHRLKFVPEIWMVPRDAGEGAKTNAQRATDPERVKQVWFEGAHSDIGGGSAMFNSLSDTTLLWMLLEAHKREGLEVNYTGILELEVDLLKGTFGEHRSLTPWYRVIDAPRRLRSAVARDQLFSGRNRVLDPAGALNVKVASSALRRYRGEPLVDLGRDLGRLQYRPENLRELEERAGGLDGFEEKVVYVPFDSEGVKGLRKILPESFTHVEAERRAEAARDAGLQALKDKVHAELEEMHRRGEEMRKYDVQLDAITAVREMRGKSRDLGAE